MDPMASIIDSAGLGELVAELRRQGFTVVAPTLRDNAIVLAEIDSADELPYGWGVDTAPGSYRVRARDDKAAFGHSAGPQSWKQFLHPPRQLAWSSDADPDTDAAQPRYAFLGVRACDLAAIGVLDRVLAGGAHPDGPYVGRRDGVVIIGVNCTEPGDLCFCASMGTGPGCGPGRGEDPAQPPRYDLALTEFVDGESLTYLVEVGSEEGAQLLSAIPGRPAQSDELSAAAAGVAAAATAMGRRMPEVDLRQLLVDSRESEHWSQIASRCLTCGNCTMVCPTCFCTSTSDVTDLTGQHAERWTEWASCFEVDFTFIHEGPVRPSAPSRYRHWLTHKLSSWHDQFDTSGCVGCGRCIAWCPTGIDITEEMAVFAREQAREPGDD
jgi:ferredoxin